MKYIRTKDGVFEVVIEDNEINMFQVKGRLDSVEYKDVIAKSDIIKELCDEFYLEWNKNEFPYSTIRQHERYGGFGDLKRAIRDKAVYGYSLNKDYVVYGGIWTETGFDYVAKMNDEEELKLL